MIHTNTSGNSASDGPLKPARTTYLIDWYRTKRKFDQEREQYNQGKPLKDQIRRHHIDFLNDALIFYYQRALQAFQIHTRLVPGKSELPPLYTNNAQLSKRMGVSEKTIRNWRRRLRDAGIITERFRGSNSSFAVQFNLKLLHVKIQGWETNISYCFDPSLPEKMRTPPDLFSSGSRKTLPHTVSRNTPSSNNQLSKLEGVLQQEGAGSQVDMPKSAVGSGGKPVENPTSDVEERGQVDDSSGNPFSGNSNNDKPQASSEQAPPSSGRPPQTAPETVKEAASHLDEKLQKAVLVHINTVWAVAASSLYDGFYLNEAEIERGKARIAEYFVYSDPRRWSAGGNEIITRIALVRRWILKRKEKGLKAYVTIPSIYFDIRTEHGFRVTKSWFKAHRKSQIEIQDRAQLTIGLKQYTKALLPGSKISPAEAYRRITQRLGKRSQRLVKDFNRKILELQPNEPCTNE
ncbi:hypothetical protein [Phaeodactylibacter xiamenensis]|uniref:hypothetical protein n=1 Tax=Phaeodactylibacter xiamenensis TaxID=1524460 RepID=UPI0024A7D090|nr:hypothetical protein [Phaeodactylibacter xiamenensis]